MSLPDNLRHCPVGGEGVSILDAGILTLRRDSILTKLEAIEKMRRAEEAARGEAEAAAIGVMTDLLGG